MFDVPDAFRRSRSGLTSVLPCIPGIFGCSRRETAGLPAECAPDDSSLAMVRRAARDNDNGGAAAAVRHNSRAAGRPVLPHPRGDAENSPRAAADALGAGDVALRE